MLTPKKSAPAISAAELVVHRSQFTDLSQFLARVGNSVISDSQSLQLQQLLGNLNSYVFACPSDPFTEVLQCVNAAHALQLAHRDSKIESLSAQLETLKKESARPNGDSELISYLTSRLHLTEDIHTRKGLVHEIQAKIVSSGPLLSSLVQTFRLRPDLTVHTVIPALVEKMQVTENTQLRATVEQQQAEIERLLQTAESPRDAKRYQRCKAQVKDLSAALDALSKQFDAQADELTEAVKYRSVLGSAVTDLLSVAQAHENRTAVRTGSFDVFPILESIAVPGVQSLCRNDGVDPNAKARQLVDLVNSAFRTGDSPNPLVSTLKSIVFGLLRFLTSLSTSPDLATLIGQSSIESYRDSLADQLTQLHEFLTEHAIGYVEDSCLFEEVLKHRTTADLIDTVNRFIPSTPADEELFLDLLQAIAANDVLRKFAADSKETNARQRRELKALRGAAGELERQRASDDRVERDGREQALNDAIAAIRSRLRRAVIDDESAAQPVLDGLQALAGIAPLEDAEYIESLEQQIAELRGAISESDGRVEATVKDLDKAQADIKRVEERLAGIQREAELGKEAADSEKVRLTEELYAQTAELANAHVKADALAAQNVALADQLREVETAAKTTLVDLEHTFEETKSDCFRLLDMKDARIKELEGRVTYIRGRSIEQKKQFRTALFRERNERNALEIQLREKVVQVPPQELTILNDAIERLRNQAVALKKRLASKERQHSQEIEALEGQIAASIAKANADAQVKIDLAAKSIAADAQQFLASFSKLFVTYADGHPTQSLAAADAVLRRVKADVDRQPSLLKAKGVLDAVKAILKPDKDVVAQVEELVRLGDERGELARLKQEIRAVTLWIEKLFTLYARDEPSGPAEFQVMKQAIEDALRKKSRRQHSARATPKHGSDRPSRGSPEPISDFIFDH